MGLSLTHRCHGGPGKLAEVIYGFENKHFFDILFIHLSLFKNNPHHLQVRQSVYTIDVLYIC